MTDTAGAGGRRLRLRLLWGLGAAAAGLGLALLLDGLGVLTSLEDAAYGWRVRSFPPGVKGDPPVVLVLVDQQSLDILEREAGLGWPWGRDTHAAIIEALRSKGARVVGFDVLFTEPSSLLPEGDEALEEATGGSLPVFHAMDARRETSAGARRTDPAEEAFLASHAFPVEDRSRIRWEEVNQLVLPIEPLTRAAAGIGSIRFQADPDGQARSVELMVRRGGRFLPSLPLAMACELLGKPEVRVDAAGTLHLGDTSLPLTGQGRLRLRFRGPPRSYPSYAAFALIQDFQRELQGQPPLVRAEPFRDAAVLVGTNLSEDLKRTPYAQSMPGVEIHANTLASLVAGRAVRPAPRGFAVLASLLLALLSGLGIVLTGRAVAGACASLGAGLLHVGGAAFAFARWGQDLPVAAPLTALGATLMVALLGSYLLEGRQRRFLRKAFEHYLSPQVIESIVREPDKLRLGGVSLPLTVFFSDLQGFTSMSERLTPEQLVAILNRYLSEMTDIILLREGTVDKFIGDAIMAFWGAPMPRPDHSRLACLAALENLRGLHRMGPELAAMGAGEVKVRIGLNSGPAVVGNMGSERAFNYTAMGDTVNLASRLEGVNKEYGSHILVSHATREAAGPGFLWRELDLLRVKGKEEAVRILELMAREEEATEVQRKLVAIQEEALGLYRAREFAAAAKLWREALKLRPDDGPARTLAKRALLYATAPPAEDWKGEHVMLTK